MFGRELHVRSRVQNTAAPDFTEHHQATRNPSIRTFAYSIFSHSSCLCTHEGT